MIIGLDGNEANVTQAVGVSVYAQNLLYYFQKNANKNNQFKIFLRNKPLSFLPQESEYFKYIIVQGKAFWSQLFLPLNLYFQNKVDVFFSPAHYAPRFCPVPLVVTIHDLSYFYYPNEFLKKDLYKLRNWTKYSVKKASKIISVSKTTKKDLMKFYEIPDEKITVIYNGGPRRHPEQGAKRRVEGSLNLSKPYILFVGTLQPRKNINVLIDAFSILVKTSPDIKLVITGKKGWLFTEIFKKVTELNLEDKIIFTDHISDDELTWLYKNALCFVMPSLYEGFGIPILEAMENSCPVISSFSSSLPEVAGEAALYFDPTNSSDLLEKINQLLINKDLKNDLIKKGKERVKQFSWEKSAKETLEIIQSAI